MKKLLAVLLVGSVCLGFVNSSDSVKVSAKQAKSNVAVLVDGRKIKFQGGDPFMVNGRVQVPLRGVGEALGARVEFNGPEKKVKYAKGDKSIELTIGSQQAVVDGQSVTMDTTAKAIQGRTYVPLRFVSENLGESVSWDSVGQWVWIGEKTLPNTDNLPMQSLDKFKKYYTKDTKLLNNFRRVPYEGIKVFQSEQLPLRLSKGNEVYSISKVKIDGENFVAVRSNQIGTPIYFMVENGSAKYRREVLWRTEEHSDGTVTSYFSVKSEDDVFVNGELVGGDWTKFDLKSADYIAFRTEFPDEYIVAIVNPFK
ncbi:copper amine oxidase N-terminal domain-containing protein [Paenibacillus rubinfantis]|uniref:copper amine oxidase N-terminal domain-containing protein n=1 Tax=Paenibacillus rubinfantis TaxID=1720296 RepID=UPI00073E5B72|nr:copper amine oxidase N-terminal domain-containing protein [Paenibacillus rubinfantis]